MNPTYQNRRTGEFFERVWINGSHVGLVSLHDGELAKVKRSNLTKSFRLADDYRHVPPAPDPPEPIGEPLPVRVGDKLPGPNPAPRPVTTLSDARTVAEVKAALRAHKASEGEQPAPASSTSRDALVRGGEPPGEAKAPSSRPSEESFKGDYPWSQPTPDAPVRIVGPERFWNWPTIAAVVLSALFVVVMWLVVLS